MIDQNPRKTAPPDDVDEYLTRYTKQRVREEAQKQGVDPSLAERQFGQESAYKPDVIKGQRRSPAGAIGAGQLMPGTAKELGVNPYDIDENVTGSVRYMKQQLDAFGGDRRKALAAYNAGPGAVKRYGGVPPYKETQNYVNKIEGAQAKDDIDDFLSRWKEPEQQSAQTRTYPKQYMGSETDPARQKADKANWSRQFSTNFDINEVGPGSTTDNPPKITPVPRAPRQPSTQVRNVFNKTLEQDQRAAAQQARTALDFRPAGGNVVRLEEQSKGVTRRVIASPQDAQRMAAREQYQQLSPTQRLATRVAARLGGAAPNQIEEVARPVTDIEQAAGSFARGVGDVTGAAIRGVPSVVRNPYMPIPPKQGVAGATDELARRVDRGMQAVAPVNPDDQGWMTTKIPRAAGSVVPFVAGGALTGGSTAAPAVMGALASAGQYRKDVADSGKQIAPGRYAAGEAFAVATGLTEALGIGRALNKMGVAKPVIERAAQILEESGQEYAQKYLEDINAKLVTGYDPSRSLSPTDPAKLEAAALGAILGGGTAIPSIPGDIRAQREARIGAQQVAREPQRPMNLTPTAVGPTERVKVTPGDFQRANLETQKGFTEPLTEPLAPPQVAPTAPIAPAADAAPAAAGMPNRADFAPGFLGDVEYQAALVQAQRAPKAAKPAKAAAAAKPAYDPTVFRSAIDDAKIQAGEAEAAGNWEAARDQYRSAMDTITEMQKEARKNRDAKALTELAREKSATNTNWQMAKRNAERAAKMPAPKAPEAARQMPQVQQAQQIANGAKSSLGNAEKPLSQVNLQEIAPTRGLSAPLPASDIDGPLPDWARHNIGVISKGADASGLADKIEQLAAEGRTAKEVARELGTDVETVRAVRANRGIPSADTPEFVKWAESKRSAAAPLPASAESAPQSRPEVAAPAAPKPARGLQRNFRAGMNDGSMVFESETQRDLYDLGAALRGGGLQGGRNRNYDQEARIAPLYESLQQRLGLSRDEVQQLAMNTHQDVRGQMKGVKHLEERRLVDNLKPKPQPVEEITQPAAEASPAQKQRQIAETQNGNVIEPPVARDFTNRITEGAGDELPRWVSRPLEGQPAEVPQAQPQQSATANKATSSKSDQQFQWGAGKEYREYDDYGDLVTRQYGKGEGEWTISDNLGGRAFGDMRGGEAFITRMDAAPPDKKYLPEAGGLKRRGFFRNLIRTLQNNGAQRINISLQSTDTRAAIARLLEMGELINPRGVRGSSGNEHPTIFDIPRVEDKAAPTVKESLTVEPPAPQSLPAEVPDVPPSAADRLARLRAAAQQAPPMELAQPERPSEAPPVNDRLERLKRIANQVNQQFAQPEQTAPQPEAPKAQPEPVATAKRPPSPTGEPKLSNRVVKQSLQEEMGATSTNRSDKLRLSGPSENYREVVTRWEDAPEGTVFRKPEHYGDETNVLFDRRLEDRKTTNGDNAVFFMEAQSDWHQSKDAPPAPMRNTWLRRALDDTAREAAEAGQDGVLLPKTVEQLYEIQRWGAVKEKDGRYTNSEGFDITPVVRRYLKELPDLARKAASKNGVKLETRTVDDGRGGKEELWFLPVKKTAKPAEAAPVTEVKAPEKSAPQYSPEEAALREREALPPIERRRALRDAVPRGQFGKLSEAAYSGAPRNESLAGNAQLRRLLGLPEMPPYRLPDAPINPKTGEPYTNPAWAEAAQDTLNALAALAGKERSSQINFGPGELSGGQQPSLAGKINPQTGKPYVYNIPPKGQPTRGEAGDLYLAVQELARRRGEQIEPSLRAAFKGTVESARTAKAGYEAFVVDERLGDIENSLREIYRRGKPSREENKAHQDAFREIAAEYGVSTARADAAFAGIKAQAASSAQRAGEAKPAGANQGEGEGRSGRVVGAVEQRATGTDGRSAEGGGRATVQKAKPVERPARPAKSTEQQLAAVDEELAAGAITEKAAATMRERIRAAAKRASFGPLENEPSGPVATMFGGQKILDNLRAGRRKIPSKTIPADFNAQAWIRKAAENLAKQTLSDADKAKVADPKTTAAERAKIYAAAKIDPAQQAAFQTAMGEAFAALSANDYNGFQDAANRLKAISDAPATNWEKASAIRKAAMLSRPVSHLRNLIGNTAFQNLEEVARIPGSIGDAMLSAATGRRTLQGASVEDSARAIYAAATDGVTAAKDAMKGRSNEEIAKALQTKEVNFNNKAVDKAVKFVFRSLGAEDQIFYVGAYDRAIREAAKLQARNEARQGIIKRADLKARQDALLAAPTPQMEIDATLAANTAVFRNKNKLSTAIGGFRDKLGDKQPGQKDRRYGMANFALDLVLPFDRTPTNVVFRALEYSPLGLARGLYKGLAGVGRVDVARQRAKKAGTPSKADVQAAIDKAFTPAQQRSAAQLLGRGTVGSGLLALGYALAAKGLMTGFYDDEDYKGEAMKRATGAQPLAVQIGGRWYGLNGVGPIGMALGMGATMHDESKKKGGDMFGASAKAAKEQVMEAPLLSSLKDLSKDVERVSKDRANAGKLVGNLASSFVPGVLNDLGQSIPYVRDPFEREVKDDPKKVKGFRRAVREGAGQVGAKIPGVRRMLPVKKDITGKPVPSRPLAPIDPFSSRPATGPLPRRR